MLQAPILTKKLVLSAHPTAQFEASLQDSLAILGRWTNVCLLTKSD